MVYSPNIKFFLSPQINLASQSVLEGLNAVLDHRGEVFIPELGMVFTVQPGTRLFACQNPISQGGGRKGLPKSFLNRFTMVRKFLWLYTSCVDCVLNTNELLPYPCTCVDT